MLDQKDSIMALSNASPTEPKDGMRPASRIRSVKDQEVNWTPWSAWTTDPFFTRRCLMAMSSALTTRFVSWAESMDQPTMRRLQVSSTQQQ